MWREGRHQSCQVFIHLPPAGACWCWHITTGKTALDNNQRKCIRVTCLCTCVSSYPDPDACIYLFTFLTLSGHWSLVFMSVTKVRKLQIRFQVFIVIFIFISEFNKFVGFLWCQLFIGLSLVSFRDKSHQEMNFIGLRNEVLSMLHSFYFWEGERKEKEPRAVGAKLLRIEF